MRWALASLAALSLVSALGVYASMSEAQTPLYSESFDGTPSSPEPMGANSSPDGLSAFVWREFGGDIPADEVVPMQAQHGPSCEPPSAGGSITHQTSGALEESVYRCVDHLMTAIDHGGLIYEQVTLRPHVQATLPLTIRFDTSTLRTSSRDWTTIMVSPVADALIAPYELNHDLDGLPWNGLMVQMAAAYNTFGYAKVVNNGVLQDIDQNRKTQWQDNGIPPSAQVRSTVEIIVTETTLTTRMQRTDGTWLTWFDDYPLSLDWTGEPLYVQFNHNSYDPLKGEPIPNVGAPSANTWHWDNLTLEASGSVETVIRANPYVLYDFGSSGVITLDEPAEGLAWFAFTDHGAGLTVSVDGGPLQNVVKRPSHGGTEVGRGATGAVVLPAGSQVLTFACAAADPCEVRGLEVVGEASVVPTPTPTPTPTPEPCFLITSERIEQGGVTIDGPTDISLVEVACPA